MDGNSGAQLIYLKGSYDLIWSRMTARAGHYMMPAMLQSQFNTLEEPLNAIVVDVELSIAEIIKKIIAELNN